MMNDLNLNLNLDRIDRHFYSERSLWSMHEEGIHKNKEPRIDGGEQQGKEKEQGGG
jgi:hypothetical protein